MVNNTKDDEKQGSVHVKAKDKKLSTITHSNIVVMQSWTVKCPFVVFSIKKFFKIFKITIKMSVLRDFMATKLLLCEDTLP